MHFDEHRVHVLRHWLLAALIAIPVARAMGQQDDGRARLGVSRVGTYLSVAWADHGRNGREYGADLDVGSVFTTRVHLDVGLNYFAADVDRTSALGQAVPGRFHDFSVHAEASVDLARVGRVVPYMGAGMGPHIRGSHGITDPATRELYRGTVMGGHFFGGMAVDITRNRRYAGYLEVRRVAAQNVGRTLARLGLIVRLRGGTP